MHHYASRLNTAVIGLQFGDEGKGQVVDGLTDDHDVVVRFNGGANAGHSVWIGKERFALHQIPSGILSPGKRCHIGYGCVVEPDSLLGEIAGLRSRGVEVGTNLTISARAHVVLPRHIEEDRLRGAPLGTTGRGIGLYVVSRSWTVQRCFRETLLSRWPREAARVSSLVSAAATCAA